MTSYYRTAALAAAMTAAALLTGCSSTPDRGAGGTPLDLDATSCADWATASDATKALNAESLLLVLRRAAKTDPEEPNDDQIDGLVSDIDSGCASGGKTAGGVGSTAVITRSDFFLV